MSIVPDGYLTFREALKYVNSWLLRPVSVKIDDEERRHAECENQLHHALLAGDIKAWSFHSIAGKHWINSQYWLDSVSFQRALSVGLADHPRDCSPQGKGAHPVFILEREIKTLLFGNQNRNLGAYRHPKRKPYRLLRDDEWNADATQVETPETVNQTTAPSGKKFREAYVQRLAALDQRGERESRQQDRDWAKSTYPNVPGIVSLVDKLRNELSSAEKQRGGRPAK